MATAVALLAKERGGLKIGFQLLFYPVTDANFDTPSYQQFAYAPVEKHNVLRLMAAPDTNHLSAARIHQDARMYAAVLDRDNAITYTIPRGRHVWLHCAAGHMDVNGIALEEGDGVAVSDEASLELRGSGADGAELLLFDLA